MRLFILLTVVFAFVVSVTTSDLNSRLVQINSGPVRGYKDPQEDIFAFYGIPYATAPNGTQRFKAPLPPPVWVDILEATIEKSIVCPQFIEPQFFPDLNEAKEDCLIASVFVPDTPEKNLSVVVYVHGGSFVFGFGDAVTPKKIVNSKKIIAVTFNYRLGAHGFLCLGSEDVPGNAGMKDQVALLRWVKDNIASFGGNPNDVTIAGYSAGSSSVDMLMISKMATGLFHKVIPESGASIAPFSFQVDPTNSAKEYAKLLGIDNVDDMLELENYFKTVSYDILQSGNVTHRKDSTFLFAPCIERDNGQEIFLDDSPVNILKQGNFTKLPMLYGFAEMEGLFRISSFDTWKKEMNENFTNFLPADLDFKTEVEKDLAVNMIKNFYFGEKPIDENTVLEYVGYMSDVLFSVPILRVVSHLLKLGHNQIFLYQYSYTDENTPFVHNTKVRGATHSAQSFAVLDDYFENISSGYPITEDYVRMKSIMRELWVNFIINGVPAASGIPAWPPVGENWSPHMDLKNNTELRGSLLKERSLFWENIYDLQYKFPIPPTPYSNSASSYFKQGIINVYMILLIGCFNLTRD